MVIRLVIEHNLDVIKTADYIIDIGPEGGAKGGTVIAEGTPEEVALNPVSYTSKYIDMMLKDKPEKKTFQQHKVYYNVIDRFL